jgi:hypothetical protein
MKRLSPAKQQQLIGVLIATLAVIGGIYFFLISPQEKKNADLAAQIHKDTDQLALYQNTIKLADAKASEVAELNQELSQYEDDIASGDVYEWTYEKIMRGFKSAYKVEIPNLSQPTQTDCDLIGGFPYRQIRFSLIGTAYFHDLGKFVSDFENKFPHCRVLNLSVDMPVNPASERLSFHMEIAALVKPTS